MSRLDEYADVVDEHDRVVGSAARHEIRARKLLHRGVAVLCRNSAGQVYVHRRTHGKDIFPGMYDMWVGGMVAVGEDYATAAARELGEELGIHGVRPRFRFKFRYDGPDNPAWSAVFDVLWDGDVRLQPEEIAWGAFLDPADLDRRMRTWPFAPDSLEAYRRYRARGSGAVGQRRGRRSG